MKPVPASRSVRFGMTVAILAGVLSPGPDRAGKTSDPPARAGPFLVVLGTAQDGGLPQAGCERSCCRAARAEAASRRRVSSLGIVDPASSRFWMIDATPDFPEQLHRLHRIAGAGPEDLAGIFLTHAHTGHYTGLMHLGREAMGARGVAVHAMPRMRRFLETNGPWDQLVRLGNISLVPLAARHPVPLAEGLSVTPFPVPHRDEFSETVGYRIRGSARSAVYLPDIDGWDRWERSLADLIREVDVVFLDGTFYSGDELPGRDLAEIPHPFIRRTMERLADLPPSERAKVHFLHLNHTNPAGVPGTAAREAVEAGGFRVAAEGRRFPL